MNEIAKKQTTQVSGVSDDGMQSAADMLVFLKEMTSDPETRPSDIVALAELQLKLYDRARLERFNKDKNAAIDAMPIIKKDGKILSKSGEVRSRFSTFERLMSAVSPILAMHSLRLTFDVMSEGNLPKVATILTHNNGHTEKSGHMPVPIDKPNSTVTAPQAAAMSVTLGKRHVMKATLGIIEEDDDGQGKFFKIVEKQEWQEPLEMEAKQAALHGVESLVTWYKSQSAMKRGYLFDTGLYEKLKKEAAKIEQST